MEIEYCVKMHHLITVTLVKQGYFTVVEMVIVPSWTPQWHPLQLRS